MAKLLLRISFFARFSCESAGLLVVFALSSMEWAQGQVVEMHEGQTLMISGLMQLTLTGNTNRIPGLGDLPIIGPFFSNTSSNRAEKELVILVTPYLVEPMNPGQVPPTPGDEVNEPNDLELYFLNRIEARTGRDVRSTTTWDDPFYLRDLLHLESKFLCGPHGFAE